MPQKQKLPSSKPSNPEKFNYLKLSGLAFEMLAFIIIGVWGGMKLDAYFELEFPAITITGAILGITGSIINLIRKLPKE